MLKKSLLLNCLLIVISMSSFFAIAPGAMAGAHFVDVNAGFNFSLSNNGWFESPLNEKFFFNIVPDLTLILEDSEKNVLLSICRLDKPTYTDELDKAYEKILGKITADTDSIIFLKQNFSYNDINFKDIFYKDKHDMSNFRVILARDMKKTQASSNQIFLILFYYPKKSDMMEADDDANTLLKTFMFKTELPQPSNDQLLGKGASCMGEFISLFEQSLGSAISIYGDKKIPVYKDTLVKMGSVVETRGGSVSLKLNDGTVMFLDKKTKMEFVNVADIKMEAGEAFIKCEQLSGQTNIRLGNFVKMASTKGEFSLSAKPAESSNANIIKIAAITGECEISGDGGNAALARQKVEKGKMLVIEINDLGKLISSHAEFAPEALVKNGFPDWAKPLLTHKIYESFNYLEKLKEYK
ncbi:MAG TPA: hypothetical protein PKK26_00700 [Candidatus Wallbacteria bacterium]|nr:hypothetical protein [Candidatus Wallbacteria bacterium]